MVSPHRPALILVAKPVALAIVLSLPQPALLGAADPPSSSRRSQSPVVVGRPTPDRLTTRISTEGRELVSDFTWGYRIGIKQPLGAFKDGLTLHQMTKSIFPIPWGNPDYIPWVDEMTATHGISQWPTGTFTGNHINTGGMVAFADDGTIWYTFGGRAQDLPLDLFVSTAPYDFTSFDLVLDDFETGAGSTTPCVNVAGSSIMLSWRRNTSACQCVRVKFRRYFYDGATLSEELDLEVGQGEVHPTLGTIGIEQLWTRSDPRFGYQFLSWTWFNPAEHEFGSCPFLYSDDDGDTWRSVVGQAVTLPLRYSDVDGVIVPYDHLAFGETTEWYVGDLGVAPNGNFWMVNRAGDARVNEASRLAFWRFEGGQWLQTDLSDGLLAHSKPFACGVTRDYVVAVYADLPMSNVLKVRFSEDDGATWSEPQALAVLDESLEIPWVSFVQPADDYVDNTARFFWTYYRKEDGNNGRSYQNNLRWAKVTIADGPPTDLAEQQRGP